MTSNYDFALRGSDRSALKFRQLYVIWNPRRRHSASVAKQDTLDYIAHRFVSFIALINFTRFIFIF
jgi:hypothetical protein